MAFGRDPLRRDGPDGPASRWLLATGDEGGTITAWDLRTRLPRTAFNGSRYQVHSLDFSPDGSLLASAGRGNAMLWDAAKGRLLLHLDARNWLTALAFSPDGGRLAVAHKAANRDAAGVTVYDIEDGRGLRHLYGARGFMEKLVGSRSGRLVAALTVNWQVAVWDAGSGRLRHVFEAPAGYFADNAAIAFSPDDRSLAVSSGTEARLWDLESGRLTGRWALPAGLEDALLCAGPDRWIVVRAEARGDDPGPTAEAPIGGSPQVCRVRELAAGAPPKRLREIDDFPHRIQRIRAAPDGSTFAVAGLAGAAEAPIGRSRLYDPAGVLIGALPDHPAGATPWLDYDPSGTILSGVTTSNDPTVALREWTFEVPSFRPFDASILPGSARARDARWRRAFVAAPEDEARLVLVEAGRAGTLATFRGRQTPGGYFNPSGGFSPDGRFVLALNDSADEVLVADLVAIQRRLAALGMGW